MPFQKSNRASFLRASSCPVSDCAIENEPRFGVPSWISRPPRPLPVGSFIAFQVSRYRLMKQRDTSPPIECAIRWTGPPSPNALTSPFEPRGAALDRLAPVEGERPHVPVVVELEQHRDVVLPVQPGRW